MNKQLRILIGDIGDEFAANIAVSLIKNGEWVITRQQQHETIVSTVRREHPDVLILNLSVSTIHVAILTEELLRHSDLLIIALYRQKNDGIEKILTRHGVHYIPFPEDISEFVSYVYRLSGIRRNGHGDADDQKNPESSITSLLHNFGIPTKLRGFHYLRCAIMTAYKQDQPTGCVMNHIYPMVAEKLHSTPSRVERAIRHAITQAWENADQHTGWTFGFADGHRMTNSEFISFAVDWLQSAQSAQRCS